MNDLTITGIFIVLMTIHTVGYNHIVTKIEKKKYYNERQKGE